MKSIKLGMHAMTISRMATLALSVVVYMLLVLSSHGAGYDLSSWATIGYVVCLGLLSVLLLSNLPMRISVYFVVMCAAATVYLAWPQTAAWRLQYAQFMTTQSERNNADFILALDIVIRQARAAAGK